MQRALVEAGAAESLPGGDGAPLVALLAALAPPGSSLPPAGSGAAFAPTAESVPPRSAPRLPDDASATSISTSAPTRELAPVRARASRRARLAMLGVGLGALALSAVAVVAARGKPRPTAAPPLPAPPSAQRAATPAGDRPAQAVIFGVVNRTTDPLFDQTVDVVLARTINRSGVVSAIALTRLRALAEELDPALDPGDDRVAEKLLARDGGRVLGVRGQVTPKGAGYVVALTATDARTGAVVLSTQRVAEVAARIVPTVALLACDVRRALGDTPPADPRLAEETDVSLSIEADHALLVGSTLLDTGKYEEATVYIRRAVALDPSFAKARWVLASVLQNTGHRGEAILQLRAAIQVSGGLREEERAELQAEYYGLEGDYGPCITTYEGLLQKDPKNDRFETVLAGFYRSAGRFGDALALARRSVLEHPEDVIPRTNLVGARLAVSDVEGAAAEGADLLKSFPRAPPHVFVYLALAESLRGHADAASAAYAELLPRNAGLATLGLADLALAEGRVDDAISRVSPSLAAVADADARARVRAMLAEARLRGGDRAGALAAAREAATTEEPTTLYQAAVTELGANDTKGALAIAGVLRRTAGWDGRVFGAVLEAEASRLAGKPRQAVTLLEGAGEARDTWLGRLALARAKLDAGDGAGAEQELRACLARRGEGALALGEDAPTARYVPPVTYHLARALELQGRADEATAAYEEFLAKVPRATHDPLAEDARRRLGRK
jgi:tetratricopeptide (TPR) repeat protein